MLRERQGIWSFTDECDCLFRLALITSEFNICLSDRTKIAIGDPLIELHLWNEHLPVMPSAGPSAAWAVRLLRQMRASMVLLDRYLEQEPSLNRVAAVMGSSPFASRLGGIQMARTAERFGFEILDPEQDSEWGERMHMIFDSMLLWALGYTFNPSALRGKRWLRQRYHLWISRAALHRRVHQFEAAAIHSRH